MSCFVRSRSIPGRPPAADPRAGPRCYVALCQLVLTRKTSQLLGLDGVRADIAVVRTPDGHGRVELSTFHTPVATSIAPRAPMNTPGIPRLTFVVDAVDDVLDRLRAHGAELVGEVAQYRDIYRYCYVRGPDGIIIGLVEELR
jgi:catechol 2,3-dioxygenase-like lactoylglutathione lyase family enzyme